MATKKLTLLNCEPLLHLLKARFSSWSVKALSFAGRLLIKTVISGITTFWCSSFILPKACIKRINSLCGIFLWNRNMEGHHTARVAWDKVTLTKEQVGLGVKDLYSWNRVCILKLIWLLFFRPDSVWVCWFKEIVLKGSLSNYWLVNTSSTNSWLANKLIKSCDLLFPLIKRKLGNGLSTRFWYDNWSPFGNLNNYLNASTRRMGIPNEATVSSLFSVDHWLLPPARTENQLALQIHLTTVNLSLEDDSYVWEVNGKIGEKFRTSDIYTYIIGPKQNVSWASVVWCSYGILRQSFLTWLVLLDRCPTKDRIIRWGIEGIDLVFLLCNFEDETRDHLFFDCAYSRQVWSSIAFRCQLQPCNNWETLIALLQSLQGCKDLKRLTLLSFQATIYSLWTERNTRLHQQSFHGPTTLISLIDRQIRNMI